MNAHSHQSLSREGGLWRLSTAPTLALRHALECELGQGGTLGQGLVRGGAFRCHTKEAQRSPGSSRVVRHLDAGSSRVVRHLDGVRLWSGSS